MGAANKCAISSLQTGYSIFRPNDYKQCVCDAY